MSRLETNQNVFGAVGVTDPSTFVPNIAFRREIDFSKIKDGVKASVNYEFIPVPKGFVMTGIVIDEIELCDGTENTVGVKTRENGTAVAENIGVGGANKAFSATAVNQAFAADDMLCIVMGKNTNEGKIGVSVVGYCASEDTFATAQCPVWRKSLQTMDNVSGGQLDPRERVKFPGVNPVAPGPSEE